MACPHTTGEGPCSICAAEAGARPSASVSLDGDAATLASTSGPVRDVLAAGATVGRYVIKELVGAGGMGVVYTAYDPQLDRLVALKLLRTLESSDSNPSGGQTRLLREAQAMAQLSHPNVVPVFDVGTHGTSVFVAMELVRGATLDKWLKQAPRSWQEVIDLFIHAGRGLLAAHHAGLVHRDFKPPNVLVGDDGRPRVVDFGIARSTRTAEAPQPDTLSDSGRGPLLTTPLTRAGALMGSPGYMAPEQYAGAATSPATDQFAFCVSLYEALYGKRPFAGTTLRELATSTSIGKVPPAPKGSTVPPWIHRILEQGLSPEPARRHASMGALLFALSHDPARALRRWLAMGGGALAIIATGLGVGWLGQEQARACQGSEQRLIGVWDSDIRTRAQQAFEATGKSYAGLSWRTVNAALDKYSRAWVAARTDACAATRVRKEQSEPQLQLRYRCLELRLEELKVLAGAFETASAAVVDQSAGAVAHLTGLASCANLKSLEDRRQPPPESKQAVERLEQQLAQGRALLAAGKFADARAKIQPAVAQAEALGLLNDRAEAEVALGTLERETRNFPSASGAFERAVRFSLAASDDVTAARSLASLVSLVGWRLERPAEGRTLASLAAGVLERIGGDERIEAELAEALGDTEWQAGQRVESLAQYRKALASMERLQGKESTDVARLHSSIGWVLTEQGAFAEARKELEQSQALREQVLGADHPALADTWNELGNLAESLGDTDKAVDSYRRTLAIERLTLGGDPLALVRAELSLAQELAAADRPTEALPLLKSVEKTLADREDAPPSNRIQAMRARGEILTAQAHQADSPAAAKAQLRDAARIIREALASSETTLGKEHPVTATLTAALARNLAELDQHAEALEKFDRYLGIQGKLAATADPAFASALADSARPLLGLKRSAEAISRLERAVALLPYEKGNARRAALARLALADALWATGADHARARSLVLEAQPKLGRPKEVERVEAWLAAHPEQ